MKHYGIDGCKGGWVVAEASGEGGSVSFRILPRQRLAEIFQEADTGGAIVVIDMPIGLPDREPRTCDGLARRVVGPRRASSVFPVPCRAAVYTKGNPSLVNERVFGKRLSRQSLAILDRIREVDELMGVERQKCVREAHPEVGFAVLNGGPLTHPKKTKEGVRERLCILRATGIVFDVDAVRSMFKASDVARDDIIDAAVCLATAKRIVPGAAQPIAPLDGTGLRMEIVA